MNADLIGNRRRWIASAASAGVVGAALLLLVRVPQAPSVTSLRPVLPKVEIVKKSDVADEEAFMHDQRPLFLPTPRNAAPKPYERPEAGRTMLDQDAVDRMTFGQGTLKLTVPAPVGVPARPIDLLAAEAPPALSGFGRLPDPPPAPTRGGVIEVLAVESNRRAIPLEILAPSVRPPFAGDKLWHPLEFMAVVDAGGLAAPLMLVERSTVDEVDKYFKNYLAQVFRVGERLEPGVYRILVGP